MTPRILVEACVETAAQASAAEQRGADRVELCRRLDIGGLTPTVSDITAARAALSIPLHVLIRPRAGAFVYAPSEIDEMVDSIGAAKAAGADGVVLGALTPSGEVDVVAMRRLLTAARPLGTTFHRAFDEIPDQRAALDVLAALGVERVLTSGGAATALAGADQLRELVAEGRGRIVILAGGGIRPGNVAEIVGRSGVTEVHARMDEDPGLARGLKGELHETGEQRAGS